MVNHRYRRRHEDTDKLARVTAWFEHYKPIIAIAAWFAAAAGFGILTPKQTVRELQAQINTLKTDVTGLKSRQDDLRESMVYVIRKMCIELSDHDKALIGLTQAKCSQ